MTPRSRFKRESQMVKNGKRGIKFEEKRERDSQFYIALLAIWRSQKKNSPREKVRHKKNKCMLVRLEVAMIGP